MDDRAALTKAFEDKRSHLRTVAYRILGSQTDAEDAVQEAWLRLNRTDASTVENLGGWLTTVVARVCLDMLRSRRSRREEPLSPAPAESDAVADEDSVTPEETAVLADSIGVALLVVLDTLAPPERVAFVLHDLFDLPFDEIGRILDRTPAATRQLASRARRRVQGSNAAGEIDRARQRDVVNAFLEATRSGNLDALLSVLHPDAVLHADRVAVETAARRRAEGAPAIELEPEIRGADAVARTLSGRARAAELVTIDGVPGAAFMPGGQLRAAFLFTIAGGHVAGIEVIADPARLARLEVVRAGQAR